MLNSLSMLILYTRKKKRAPKTHLLRFNPYDEGVKMSSDLDD